MNSKLSEVKKETLFDNIILQIQKKIQNGELQPGDKLSPERELADQLKVSRNTLREVLKALKLMGVIVTKQGKGTFINENLNTQLISTPFKFFSLNENKEILDLIEARKTIEVKGVALAAEKATKENIKEIRSKLDLMKENINDFKLCSRYDKEFHFSVCKASKNHFFSDLLKAIHNPLLRVMEKVYDYEKVLSSAICHHEKILEAIIEHNPEDAKKYMIYHLDKIYK